VIKPTRLIAALALAGAAFFFGLALGERGELGVVQYAFLAGIPTAASVLAIFARRARLSIILGGTAMLAGLIVGQQSFNRAFRDCSRGAPIVHAAIERYTKANDEFPHDLSKLDMKLPCRCLLRETILHYAQNERGYKLWYTNDRQTLSFGVRRPQSPL